MVRKIVMATAVGYSQSDGTPLITEITPEERFPSVAESKSNSAGVEFDRFD
jgi:hypothetical protein